MLTAKPRADLTPHWALWVIARDMATNAPFQVGYWTGDDATTITVDGQARSYYGAGAALGIEPLPRNLDEAVGLMERSELAADTLGEHVFDFFLRNKKAEWAAYREQVTAFELEQYLFRL